MAEEEGGEFFDCEIISEILARLPVKSVVRFRCASKWWSALISDPYFTKKLLSYSKEGITENTSRLLYSLDPPQSLDYEALKDLKDHSDGSFANRVLDFPGRILSRYYNVENGPRHANTIWLMKEYGVKQSWTQVLRCSREDFPEGKKDVLMEPFCILESGEVLVYDLRAHLLVLYDPEENTFKNVTKTHHLLNFGAFVYRETLVSPVSGSVVDI
ncbi:PREDICTED: F-box protein At1g67130-like [Fragaria vesca subsp. vesca]|uniref:F-box protein At1g67130-like n=1 Tax=Fragaria vesca subsp. vesca TaxID=101020 RepID=UPI0002C35627|nr:PREDICTED: F-box protein At1g67130-like [Fragaria vesca subsp. vesca]